MAASSAFQSPPCLWAKSRRVGRSICDGENSLPKGRSLHLMRLAVLSPGVALSMLFLFGGAHSLCGSIGGAVVLMHFQKRHLRGTRVGRVLHDWRWGGGLGLGGPALG